MRAVNLKPTYTYSVSARKGCDNTATLDLTIYNLATGFEDVTACNLYVGIDGNTYSNTSNGLTLYPNPISGLVSIDFGQRMQEMHHQVNNSTGQMVYVQFEVTTEFLSFDLEGLSGINLTKVELESGS